MRQLSILLATAFTLLAAARPARAVTPACDSLTNPIYIQMGSTQVDLILRLARALRDTKVTLPSGSTAGMTLVWVSSGSCTNIDDFYTRPAITANMQYVPSAAEDPSWTSSLGDADLHASGRRHGARHRELRAVHRVVHDEPARRLRSVHERPVQAYVLAVPKASSADRDHVRGGVLRVRLRRIRRNG